MWGYVSASQKLKVLGQCDKKAHCQNRHREHLIQGSLMWFLSNGKPFQEIAIKTFCITET